MSDELRQHLWTPLEDLPPDWQSLSDTETAALAASWKQRHEELVNDGAVKTFIERIKRQWAIETGAMEDVYRISEGATATLIEHGLNSALLSHEDVGNEAPESVVAKINDQLQAVNGVYQFVASERDLTTSYIRQLHQVLTAHQSYYLARDTLGEYVRRELPHGDWKKLPNDVQGDDYSFQFCPPEQVQSEVDRLLDFHRRHLEEGVSPDVEAAWLHHRFTQIHPFVDGNGRVSRCLATLVLLRSHWLPLVVTRQDKPQYLAALREADKGDLAPLVSFINRLQRKLILDAFSLGREATIENRRLAGMIETLKRRFTEKTADSPDRTTEARQLSDALQQLTFDRLRNAADELGVVVAVGDPSYRVYASGATGEDERAKYHYHQTVQGAKAYGYFANLNHYRSWAAMTLVTDVKAEVLFAFHGIGHGHSRVYGCAALLYQRRPDEQGQSAIGEVHAIGDEPFQFTEMEAAGNVRDRFQAWLEDKLVDALALWSNTLG